MKVKFKARYLQYFCNQGNHQGFSWIRFLIFLLFVCTLVPLGWLSFIEYNIRSKEGEGKIVVGSMNRAQQAYHIEQQYFSDSIETLGLGIKPDTKNYSYRIAIGIPIEKNRYRFLPLSSPKKLGHLPNEKLTIPSQFHAVVMNVALSKKPELKTYVGLVFEGITYDTNSGAIVFVCESFTGSLIWESEKPSISPPDTLIIPPNVVVGCGREPDPNALPPPKGFQEVKREGKTEQHPWFLRLRLPWT